MTHTSNAMMAKSANLWSTAGPSNQCKQPDKQHSCSRCKVENLYLSLHVGLPERFLRFTPENNLGNIVKTKETWVRALPRWRARGKFAALSSQSGRREKPMGKDNWLLSSIHFCPNLPCTLLLLLLLLHHSWLNNCHGTFNRRHHDGCRGPFSCAKVVSRVRVRSVVCNPTFSEILAFS